MGLVHFQIAYLVSLRDELLFKTSLKSIEGNLKTKLAANHRQN